MKHLTKYFTGVLMFASLIAIAFMFSTGQLAATIGSFLAVPFVFGMAKVTGPLMSIDARGKVGNAVVFMGWKGIKTVRMWLKPKNPQTEDQVAQRALFTSAVNKHHLLDGADKVAWNARTAGQALSGFNLFVKKVVDCLGIPKVWALYSAIALTGVSTTALDVDGVSDNAALVKVKWGYATGVYPYEVDETVGRVAPGPFTVRITGITISTRIYCTVDMKTANGVLGESGEYTAIPAAP